LLSFIRVEGLARVSGFLLFPLSFMFELNSTELNVKVQYWCDHFFV
jgi:hypothetical protein